MRILYVFPHPDDESFGPARAMATQRRQGHDESAWDVLAGVTAAQLAPGRREESKAAVRTLMWPHGDGPKHFRNTTHFIVGRVK